MAKDNKTLYDIGDDMRTLDALMDEAGGEVTDEQVEAAVDQWLVENKENLLDKLDGYGAVIKNREMYAAAQKAEKLRIGKLQSANENTIKRLKDRLLRFFLEHGINEIQRGKRFSWWTQDNPGEAPLILSAPAQLQLTALQQTCDSADEVVEGVEIGTSAIPAKYLKKRTQTIVSYMLDEELLRADILTATSDADKEAMSEIASIGQKTKHLRMS